VVRGARSEEVDPRRVQVGDLREADLPAALVHPSLETLPEGAWLLVDLLEHVVVEPRLPRLLGVPLDGLGWPIDRVAGSIGDLEAAGLDACVLPIVEVDHLVGVLAEGRHVRSQVGRILGDAQHQR